MSRGGFKITRADYSEVDRGDKVDWLEEYFQSTAGNEAPSAVEQARQRDASYYDHISQIMSRKPAHTTVESVVQELQERTGLKEYLRRQSSTKVAQTMAGGMMPQPDQLPAPSQTPVADSSAGLFAHLDPKVRDSILAFIKNKISTHHGQVSIPEIQHEILTLFQNQGLSPQDVNTVAVAKYISDSVLNEIKINPQQATDNANLGKGVGLDNNDGNDANSDFFAGLMPSK